MRKLLLTLAALALTSPAFANVICTGCEDGNAAGNFLGAFNGVRHDIATWQNSDVGPRSFVDFWVFDVTPASLGSMSADFTLLASIGNFAAELFLDDGSVCSGFDCSAVALGSLIATVDAVAGRWEIVDFFLPGRYVLRISGQPNPLNHGAYTGQLGFLAVAIREPGTLGLLATGLLLVGFGAWRARRGPRA
jgi:hypothetical protein